MTKMRHDTNGDCQEKRIFNQFLRKHWWEIALGIGAASGIILLVKNRETLKSFLNNVLTNHVGDVTIGEELLPLIQENTTENLNMFHPTGKIINVSAHLRNLPNGWNPSPDKLAEAAQQGIILAEHQTFVSPYIKGAA